MKIEYTLKGPESVALCFSRLSDIVDILEGNSNELEYVNSIKNNIEVDSIDVIEDIDHFIEFVKSRYGYEKKKGYVLISVLQELRLSIIFTDPFREMWERSGRTVSVPWTRKIE